jgi:hypothetical protein
MPRRMVLRRTGGPGSGEKNMKSFVRGALAASLLVSALPAFAVDAHGATEAHASGAVHGKHGRHGHRHHHAALRPVHRPDRK